MAGWTCPDRDLIEWDGTIKAKKFSGDGSALTNIPAGSETDPTFQAASGAINSHIADTNIHYTSGAIWTAINQASSATISLSGAIWNNQNQTSSAVMSLSSAIWNRVTSVSAAVISLSSAIWNNQNQTSAAVMSLSGANATFHNSLSGAYYALVPNYNTTSAGLVALSGSIWASMNSASSALVALSGANSTFHNSLSGAYYAHAGDSSDPHGSSLTQTNLILTSGAVVGDWTVSASGYIPNVIYNTTSASITASNYPIGTIMVIYS